jgi:hypothetical protein
LEEAFYWYQKAAKSGEYKAFELIKSLAEQEHINAQNSLGFFYKNGVCIEKDEDKAFYWYQKAAINGNIEAQNKLGSFYEYGICIEKDEINAFNWYRKAAENGNKDALYNLGNCYEYGIGIEKDEIKAFKWYKESAEQDFSNAQNKLGFFYKIGKGVEKDMEKAFYWFKKAEKGFENAIGWIKNTLEYEKIKFISNNELKNAVSLHAEGFGYITRAIWTKTNDYVVCKKLTNTTDIKHGLLDAFIHELKIHLHLDYSDRIVRCLGISTGN